ncbi:InlB B-repeat-containing protein [Enorma burkinafasonensis]|uniref:InlB B-repeat-containing protein n=1 Tax=Enorma burkinafasonensis TaxID=2590867 RepID=UPI00119D81B1|nr:hypothetical protein [Enorma burkinafasonensis]
MRKRFVAMLACVLAALLLLPATAFADVFTITIPERSDAIVSVTVGGVKYEEGETISVEAGAQVSAQAMQYSSTGSMFTGWSVTPEGSLALEDTKIVKFTMPEQNITLEPVIKQFEANAGVDANGVLTWEEPVAGYVSRVYVLPASSSDAITSRVAESGWVSAEQGRYTVDVRELLEEQADADELSEGAEYSIYLEYVANEAELSPNGIRGSYFNAATYTYHAVDYHLAVERVDVTSANAADVLGDGTVSYDPDTQTLTLNGAKVTQGEYKGAAIYCETGNLGIELVGDNRVVGPDLDSGNPVYSRGIYVYDGTLNIFGDGNLTVEGGDVSVPYGMAYSYGMWAAGDVEISSGTVTATGGAVTNGNGTAGSYGISANQDVVFSGGTAEVAGGDANTLSYGAYAALGDIAFTGGKLTATSGQVGTQIQPESHALYGFSGVTVGPQEGEMITVAAGMTVGDAVDLNDSPFREEAEIADDIDGKRCVLMEATEATAPLYELRVQGGTGGGMYAEGTEVTISTVEFDENGHFTGWYVVDTGGGDFEDWHDATTTFTMPANDTNVVAGYEEHTLVHHDAKAPTCTEPGWEAYVTCEGCAYTTYKEIPATGHAYEDGVCVDCGKEDPNYVAPEDPAEPSDGGSDSEGDGAIPATGDAAALAVGVPAALGAVALAAGAVARRRR